MLTQASDRVSSYSAAFSRWRCLWRAPRFPSPSSHASAARIVAHRPHLGVPSRRRHSRWTIRQRDWTIRSLGLSAEALSRVSSDLPCRRPRAARREPGAHADGSSRVGFDPVCRRLFPRARNALCVPVNEPGAVILLDIETEQPLEVEAAFTARFSAGMAGRARRHLRELGREAARVRVRRRSARNSPRSSDRQPRGDAHLAYQTNYSSSDENSMRLGVTQKGKDTKVIVIAASVTGRGRCRQDLPAPACFIRRRDPQVGGLLSRLSR